MLSYILFISTFLNFFFVTDITSFSILLKRAVTKEKCNFEVIMTSMFRGAEYSDASSVGCGLVKRNSRLAI